MQLAYNTGMATKRTALSTLQLAAEAKARGGAGEASQNRSKYKITAINLPEDVWVLLNRAAFRRAQTHGGRPSVSALLVDLVEKHRKELEEEIR